MTTPPHMIDGPKPTGTRDLVLTIAVMCLLVLSLGFFWQAPRLARVTPVALDLPSQQLTPVPMPPAPLTGLAPDVGQALSLRSLFAPAQRSAPPPEGQRESALPTAAVQAAMEPEQAEADEDGDGPAAAPQSVLKTPGRGALNLSPLPSLRPNTAAGAATLRFDSDLVLLGLFTGRENRALIANRNGETKRLTSGEMISGWQVSSISDSGVVLRKGREQMTLTMPN